MWVSWKIFIQNNSQVAGKWQVGQKLEDEEEEEESLNLGIVIPFRTMYNVFGAGWKRI